MRTANARITTTITGIIGNGFNVFINNYYFNGWMGEL